MSCKMLHCSFTPSQQMAPHTWSNFEVIMAADSVQKEVETFFCLSTGIFPINLSMSHLKSETLDAYFG